MKAKEIIDNNENQAKEVNDLYVLGGNNGAMEILKLNEYITHINKFKNKIG